MRHRHPLRQTPRTVRGPVGMSTQGPSGCVLMRHRHPIRHTPYTVPGPTGSPNEGPSGCVL
eukprot:4371425-Pyramimonas_sp.AAC.1